MTDQASTLSRWGKIRARGALRFVLVYGVIGWGLLTALLFSGGMVLFYGAPLITFPVAFVLFPIGGFAWGGFMWWFNERAYARRLAATAS